MSRSYRHQGWIQDQSCKKAGKRFANKRVRRTPDVPSGMAYKRVFCSYDIADYILPCREKTEPGGWKDWIK